MERVEGIKEGNETERNGTDQWNGRKEGNSMRKQVMGFLAGALFVSGIGFAASEFTANAGIKVLADKPASMRGEHSSGARAGRDDGRSGWH